MRLQLPKVYSYNSSFLRNVQRMINVVSKKNVSFAPKSETLFNTILAQKFQKAQRDTYGTGAINYKCNRAKRLYGLIGYTYLILF